MTKKKIFDVDAILQKQINVLIHQMCDQLMMNLSMFSVDQMRDVQLEDDNEKPEPGKCIPE